MGLKETLQSVVESLRGALTEIDLSEIIKHEGNKWILYSHDGSKKLGEFDSEEEAKKREKQIQFFKHQSESMHAFMEAGDIANLAKHLASKYGGEPGFFTSCMGADELSSYDEDTRAAVCARAHKEATGKWPGESRESATDTGLQTDCVPLIEKALRRDGTARVKIIQPGAGSSGYYSPDVLKRDGPKVFKAKTHVYWNHPTESEERERPERSVSDLAGVLVTDAKFLEDAPTGPGLYADVQFLGRYKEAIEDLAPHVGMSIRAYGKAKSGEIEGKSMPIIEEITSARSVDVVTVPGAGGQILQLFESARKGAPNTEEVKTVNEQEAKALQDENTALKAEVARLREATTLREAKDYVATILAAMSMPDLTRTRLIEALAARPTLKDGALDKEAYKAAIEAAATSELEYLAKATGSGRITGMGDAPPAEGAKLKEIYVTYYRRLGKSQTEAEKLAALAAQGR